VRVRHADSTFGARPSSLVCWASSIASLLACWDWGIGHSPRPRYLAAVEAQSLLGFFVHESLRELRCHRRRRKDRSEEEVGLLGVLAGSRWGSCPTLPNGELRLCRKIRCFNVVSCGKGQVRGREACMVADGINLLVPKTCICCSAVDDLWFMPCVPTKN
jgi:hypothetical protein